MKTQRLLLFGITATLILMMLYGWWLGSGHELTTQATKLIAIGRLAGIIATISVLLELLVMSRAPFIERNFDLHQIIEFHRYNGYAMTIALIVHMVFLTVGYGIFSNLGFVPQFIQLTSQFEDVLKAVIGAIIFFIAAITSAHIIKKYLPYEVWYFIHIIVYGAVLLAFGHQVHSGGDIVTSPWMEFLWYVVYALIFGLLGYYRFLRPLLYTALHRFTVDTVKQESSNIYSVYITGKNIKKFKYKSGQYAHWRFLSSKLWLESHPFSFTSDPASSYLRITFKATGDFTKLLNGLQPGTKVIVDGPRGSFTSDKALARNILLAGGIGITPYVSIAKTLLKQGKTVQIVYSVRHKEDAVFTKAFKQLQQSAPDCFAITYHISSKDGRFNTSILQQYLGKYTTATTVYVCGPDKMTAGFNTTLLAMGVPQKNIITERFMF